MGWGIFVTDGSSGQSTALLPSVSPTIDWVRLPQRFPVRIQVDGSAPIELRIGQTVSVTISHGSQSAAFHNRLTSIGFGRLPKIIGKGTPLVVYAKNPDSTPQEKHYPSTGITLGLTAVEEERPGQVPLLKLYDAFDPTVVRSSSGPDSMGGLLAHTLVSDSGNALWNVFADKPLNSLTLSPSEKNLISGYFFFHHQPSIERVIFLAVPHRGSGLATGIVGSVGNRLIRHVKTAAEALKELATEDPGLLNPYFLRVNARGGPTSLFSLAPNPLLDRIAALPIRVPFHSIIGDRGLGDGLRSSDGVVPYSSSHLAGAESEKIVPAGHGVFSNEAAVFEIERILEENIERPTGRGKQNGRVRLF